MQLSEIRIKNYRLLIDAKLDVDAKTTLIVGRNKLRELFKDSCYSEDKFSPKTEEMHDVLVSNFTRLFGLTIYAVNPKNLEDRQVKSHRELEDLFPYYRKM